MCLSSGQLHVTDYSNASGTGMFDPFIVSKLKGFWMKSLTLENFESMSVYEQLYAPTPPLTQR